MTTQRLLRCLLATTLLAVAAGAAAQSDDAKKAARRAQLQMQQLQQQTQEAQAAKAKIESDKAALDKQLSEQSQQMARLKGALPKAQERLKAVEAERTELATKVAALEKQLAEQKTQADAVLAAKTSELEQSTKLRDERQAQAQRSHDTQLAQVNECSAKNERLLQLSADLLGRYRNKSVAEVLSQRDPVLGLGDVKMFNLVQEYRDKADAEAFSPPINR